MYRSLLLFCAAAAGLAAEAPLPTAAGILELHMRAMGGAAAFNRLTSRVLKGTYQVRSGGDWLPAELYSKTGGKWQFIMTIPGVLTMEDVSDGSSGWAQTPDAVEKMDAAEYLSESYLFDFRTLGRLSELFPVMRVKGSAEVDGHPLWVVEAQPSVGKPLEARFDARTGLLAQLGPYRFEDYRPVDGVQVPFTVQIAEGNARQVLRVAEVRHNVPLEDKRFQLGSNTAAYRATLREMTRDQLAAGLQGIDPGPARAVLEELHNFTPQDGRMLYDYIVRHGYRRGLEIGTARGNSAVWMGMAFKKTGGRLITLEMDPERAKTAMENFRKAGLEGVVECHVQDAFKEVPILPGDFDFVFMDTGTRLHKKFLDLVYGRVPAGGTISSHNANDFERGMPDYLRAITADPNLESQVIRTPGGGLLKKKNIEELKRRAWFGAVLAPPGATIQQVAPGSPAQRAGIRKGDVIVRMAGSDIPAPGQVLAFLRDADQDRPIAMEVLRGSARVALTLQLEPLRKESSPDFEILYDSVEVAGVRQRTIVTKPAGAGPFPAVLLAGGVGCYSLDNPLAPPLPYQRILERITRQGFVTARVEKVGMGDSQGGPCMAADFNREIAGYRAGLAALAAYSFVDKRGLFLFGHSMGGISGPLVAAGTSVRGFMVMATVGTSWFEYELANTRRQRTLRGATGEETDLAVRRHEACIHALLVEKKARAELLAAAPECADHIAYPASDAYLQQVAALDLGTVWKDVDAPVAVLYGKSDYVSSAAEHEYLARRVNRLHPGRAVVIGIENLDHYFRLAPSEQAAMKLEDARTQYGDGQVADTLIAWMRRVLAPTAG